jgi:hypothetical protein
MSGYDLNLSLVVRHVLKLLPHMGSYRHPYRHGDDLFQPLDIEPFLLTSFLPFTGASFLI